MPATRPDTTLTLALPKIGLHYGWTRRLYLGDIGIPAAVYERLDLNYQNPFDKEFLVELQK